uniref:Uncharacterized protein n=1 Tax=Romanomermis culicivorax TaxID=13658 RepID=A0A915KDQ3_ROMCU
MGSQRSNQMGVKRKAPGDDKLQPDKYQPTDAKSPDAVEANKGRTKAKARGDTIKEGLQGAIEAAGSTSFGGEMGIHEIVGSKVDQEESNIESQINAYLGEDNRLNHKLHENLHN